MDVGEKKKKEGKKINKIKQIKRGERKLANVICSDLFNLPIGMA